MCLFFLSQCVAGDCHEGICVLPWLLHCHDCSQKVCACVRGCVASRYRIELWSAGNLFFLVMYMAFSPLLCFSHCSQATFLYSPFVQRPDHLSFVWDRPNYWDETLPLFLSFGIRPSLCSETIPLDETTTISIFWTRPSLCSCHCNCGLFQWSVYYDQTYGNRTVRLAGRILFLQNPFIFSKLQNRLVQW